MSDIRKYINIINEHVETSKIVESKAQDLEDYIQDLNQELQDYKDEAVGADRATKAELKKGADKVREKIKTTKAKLKDLKKTVQESIGSPGLDARWESIGADGLLDDLSDAEIIVTNKPVLLRDAKMHRKEWDRTGVPVLKFFARTFHTFDDEMAKRVGTFSDEIEIPAGTKVVLDHTHGKLYTVAEGYFVSDDINEIDLDSYNREIDENSNGREINNEIVAFLEKFAVMLNKSENTYLANKFYEAINTYKHGGKIALEVIQVLDNRLKQTVDQPKRNFIIKVLDVLRPMAKIDEQAINDHEHIQNTEEPDEFAIDAFMFKSNTSPENRYTKAGYGDNPLVAEEDEEEELNESDFLGISEDLDLFLEGKKYDYSTSSSWETSTEKTGDDSEKEEPVDEDKLEEPKTEKEKTPAKKSETAKETVSALKARWKKENPDEEWPGFYSAKEKMGLSEGIFDRIRKVSENISFADPDYADFPLQVGNGKKTATVGRRVSGTLKYGPYAGKTLTGEVIRLFPVDYAEIKWDNGYVSNMNVKELTILE